MEPIGESLKKLFNPKVIIPLVLSVALLAAVLIFGNVGQVVALMVHFQRIYLLWFLLLMIVYEIVRCAQWHFLLQALGIRVPLRSQVFAFAFGEITKSMPIGNYFQNYILSRTEGEDFGLSSAATTVIVLIEVAVSLAGVVIIGIGDWSWLRPVIVIGVAAFLLLGWGVHELHYSATPPRWLTRHKGVRTALEEFKHFREGAADLFHSHILIIAVLLGSIYLIAAGSALYLVLRGLGVGAPYFQVLSVYFFSLAVGLIFPLPVDIGVAEISGVGAFLAIGVSRTAAVGAMLVFRALSIGSAIAIAVIAMIVLNDEFRLALRERSTRKKAGAVETSGG